MAFGFRELHGDRHVVLCKGPWSPRRPRGMAMATSPSLSASLSMSVFSEALPVPLLPCAVRSVHGAAGHNRWGAAERQPLAKTQGRNMDRFNVRV